MCAVLDSRAQGPASLRLHWTAWRHDGQPLSARRKRGALQLQNARAAPSSVALACAVPSAANCVPRFLFVFDGALLSVSDTCFSAAHHVGAWCVCVRQPVRASFHSMDVLFSPGHVRSACPQPWRRPSGGNSDKKRSLAPNSAAVARVVRCAAGDTWLREVDGSDSTFS